jgi:CubicO group peptidase (beta-lactamase class C family)
VLDLWVANSSPDQVMIGMSNSKMVCSIMLACLADKGLLDFSKPVAHYWPEFAQNGKDKITVSDVVKH